MLAGVFGIEDHRRDVAELIQLTAESRIGKITENCDLHDIVFLGKLIFPCLKIGLYAVLALESDVPMLEIDEGDAGRELFRFECHFVHLLCLLLGFRPALYRVSGLFVSKIQSSVTFTIP